MDLKDAHFRAMPDAESKQMFIEFVKLCRSMREKQKEYFRTRNAFVLRDAKKLERDVDTIVRNLFQDENLQLF